MKYTVSILAAAVLAAFTFAGPASAKCELIVKASGNPSLLKTLAYNSSLWAWRNAVKFRYGPEFQPWRRAQERTIECQKGIKGGKSGWICTRRARPCDVGAGFAKLPPALKKLIKSPKTTITKTLRRGDSGSDVETLQGLLVDAGYDITVDGKFGSGTEKAVKDVQKSEGLSQDGVVGPQTLGVLT